MRYRIAVGPIAGHKTLRLHAPGTTLDIVEPPKPLTATRDGFSLNAAVACKADERPTMPSPRRREPVPP